MYKKSNNFLTLSKKKSPFMKKNLIALIALFLLTGCEAIFVENISNATVTTVAPSNESVISTGVIHFTWNSLEDATMYKLQIATPNFTSAVQVVVDTLVENTSFSKELPIGNYQWRVKAVNSDYETAYTTNSFEID